MSKREALERCERCRAPGRLRYVEFHAPSPRFSWVFRTSLLTYEPVAWGWFCRSCVTRLFLASTARTFFLGLLTLDLLEMPFQVGRNACWLMNRPQYARAIQVVWLVGIAALVGLVVAAKLRVV